MNLLKDARAFWAIVVGLAILYADWQREESYVRAFLTQVSKKQQPDCHHSAVSWERRFLFARDYLIYKVAQDFAPMPLHKKSVRLTHTDLF